MGSPSLAYWVAGLRETFEETGILLANQRGKPIATALVAQILRELREGSAFAELCERHNLELTTDEVHYVAHWITPKVRPRRFDARFFLARWPTGQQVDLDRSELTDSIWRTADDALEQITAGDIPVLTPTRVQLQWLAGFDSVEAALEASRHCYQAGIESVTPYVLSDGRVVLPGDPEYRYP